MFDIGWTEMLVIAIVMIVVVGPKDLPKMLRTFGKTTAKLRAMAGDFQKQFNEALKEAELDDVKKSVDSLRSLNPANEIRKQLNPFEKAAADVRSGLDAALKPKPPAEPASPVAHPAEPLKNGATDMPGVAGPEAMPPAPVMTPLDAGAPAAVAAATASPAADPVAAKKPRAARPKAGKVAVNGHDASAGQSAAPAKPRARRAKAEPAVETGAATAVAKAPRKSKTKSA